MDRELFEIMTSTSEGKLPNSFYENKVTGQTTRKGPVTLVTYIDPAVKKQLKLIAHGEDTTQAELFREAINDLFRKYGYPSIK